MHAVLRWTVVPVIFASKDLLKTSGSRHFGNRRMAIIQGLLVFGLGLALLAAITYVSTAIITLIFQNDRSARDTVRRLAKIIVTLLSVPILAIFLIFVTFLPYSGPSYEVIDSEHVIPSPNGSHILIIREGHIEPYFLRAISFNRFLIRRQKGDAANIKIFDGLAAAAWIDETHLLLTLNCVCVDDVNSTLHHADNVTISYHLSDALSRVNYRRLLDDQTKRVDGQYNTSETNQDIRTKSIDIERKYADHKWKSYREFMGWAHKNADNG